MPNIDESLDKAAEATEALAKAEETSAAAAEKSGISHKELVKVLSSLGDAVVPGLGRALSELAGGPIGAGLALITVYSQVKEQLDAVNEAADKLQSINLADHLANIKRVADNWDEAAKKMGDYYARLATAGSDSDPTKTQLDRTKKVTDAQFTSWRKITQAMGAQEVAALKAQGASPAQIQAAEDRTQSRLAAIDSQMESADGVGALIQEQTVRQNQKKQLDDHAKDARGKANEAGDVFTKHQDELNKARKDLNDPALGKAVEDATAKLDAAKDLPEFYTISGGTSGAVPVDNRAARQSAINEAQGERDSAVKAIQNLQDRIQELSRQITADEQNKKTAESNAKTAEDASVTNQARINQLPDEIKNARQVQDADDYGRNALAILNSHAANTNQSFGEMAATIGLTEQQKLNIITRILNHSMTMQQAWAGLENRLAQMEASHANGRMNTIL